MLGLHTIGNLVSRSRLCLRVGGYIDIGMSNLITLSTASTFAFHPTGSRGSDWNTFVTVDPSPS
jgi:hypothetical protein